MVRFFAPTKGRVLFAPVTRLQGIILKYKWAGSRENDGLGCPVMEQPDFAFLVITFLIT